jgi:cold shock CspA family protein
MKGKVISYNDSNGYGFIKGDRGEYFVHITHVINREPLRGGDKVTFEPVDGRDGKMRAVNVKLLNY